MFNIDRAADRPAWLQLADQLRERIETGEFKPGMSLPSEAELGRHTRLSRTTVRLAVAQLRAEGLVTTRRPHGTVVAEHDQLVLHAGDMATMTEHGTFFVRRVDGTAEAVPLGPGTRLRAL